MVILAVLDVLIRMPVLFISTLRIIELIPRVPCGFCSSNLMLFHHGYSDENHLNCNPKCENLRRQLGGVTTTSRPIDGQSWAKPLRQIVSVFLYLWQPNKNSHNILIHFDPFWMSICSTFRRPTRQHPTAPVGTSQASLVHRFGQVKDPEVVLEAVRQEKWPQPREFFFPYLIYVG